MHGLTTTCFLLLSCGVVMTLVCADDAVEGLLVHTTGGAVRGFSQRLRGTVVNTFIGIRYGKAPTGELRFREPQPAEPWGGVLNATETPPACIQTNVYRGVEWAVPDEAEQSEDCLFLNVWSPVVPPSTSNLTVMVWIHGGGFHQGSSYLPVYDGAFLAAYGHVVVVSMNYRLGSLGFLHGSTQSAPGNQGLLDQSLALRWVRDNIASFGGDPGSITLFGESAGSQSVLFHLLSPVSRPPFRRAIMQSGSLCTRSTKYSDHRQLARAHYLARYLNCTRASDPYAYLQEDEIECLRRVDTRQIRVAEELACSGRNCFRAIFGTSSLPDPCVVVDSGDKDILIGNVENEGLFFASYSFPVGFSHEPLKNLTIHQTQLLLASLIGTPSQEFLNDVYDLYFGSLRDTDFEGLKRAVQDAWGDMMITCPTILTSLKLASNPQNRVFYYVLNYTSDRTIENPWYGMTHFDDVQYVFGKPLLENRSSDDQTYSKKLIELWTSFAKEGFKPCNLQRIASSSRCTVSVWGALSKDGLDSLVRIEVRFNSAARGELVESAFLPYALDGPFSDGFFYLQQDRSPVHKARSVTKLLQDKETMTLAWPSQGADMNVIENVWGAVKKALSHRPLQKGSVDVLRSGVEAEWGLRRFSDLVTHLMQGLPRRMAAVIDAKGDFTKKKYLVDNYQWPQVRSDNLVAKKITNGPPEETILKLEGRCAFWLRLYSHHNQPSR